MRKPMSRAAEYRAGLRLVERRSSNSFATAEFKIGHLIGLTSNGSRRESAYRPAKLFTIEHFFVNSQPNRDAPYPASQQHVYLDAPADTHGAAKLEPVHYPEKTKAAGLDENKIHEERQGPAHLA